jgi:hypothetical protein
LSFTFFFYKIREQEGRTSGRDGTNGKEEVAGKGSRRVNTVKKMCAHACKCKNDICSKCSRNPWQAGVKESIGSRCEFKYDIFDAL